MRGAIAYNGTVFTGIIEAVGTVLGKNPAGLRIARPASFADLRVGASIAVAGACLTVTAADAQGMEFAVMPETWKCTTLGRLAVGNGVNLERAMRADGRFEGHIVQGHVEGVGRIASAVAEKEDVRLTVELPEELRPFVVPKGSIAIDGVSLTVAALHLRGGTCMVALIPYTLEHTTLGALEAGDYVNVETDVLVRAIHAMMPPCQ